jgi:hypothetical protein
MQTGVTLLARRSQVSDTAYQRSPVGRLMTHVPPQPPCFLNAQGLQRLSTRQELHLLNFINRIAL